MLKLRMPAGIVPEKSNYMGFQIFLVEVQLRQGAGREVHSSAMSMRCYYFIKMLPSQSRVSFEYDDNAVCKSGLNSASQLCQKPTSGYQSSWKYIICMFFSFVSFCFSKNVVQKCEIKSYSEFQWLLFIK